MLHDCIGATHECVRVAIALLASDSSHSVKHCWLFSARLETSVLDGNSTFWGSGANYTSLPGEFPSRPSARRTRAVVRHTHRNRRDGSAVRNTTLRFLYSISLGQTSETSKSMTRRSKYSSNNPTTIQHSPTLYIKTTHYTSSIPVHVIYPRTQCKRLFQYCAGDSHLFVCSPA